MYDNGDGVDFGDGEIIRDRDEIRARVLDRFQFIMSVSRDIASLPDCHPWGYPSWT